MESGVKKFLISKFSILLYIWLVLVAFFSLYAKYIGNEFFKLDTFIEIGHLMILTSFLAIGSGFLMVSGNLDLSSSGIGALAAVTMAAALEYWKFNTFVAIILAIVVATAVGIFNAVLVNEFRFPAFIGTMAVASVLGGVRQWITAAPGTNVAKTVNVSNEITKFIANGKLFDKIFYSEILIIVAFVIYGLILSKTKFGMQMYMVGGNPNAARLSGINPGKMSYILYGNSAFLGGIAGVLVMCRQGQGNYNALLNNQFTGLTAAILGGVSFGGGSGNMAGVFVGLLVLNTFDKGTTIINVNTHLTTILSGVLLLFALVLDYLFAMNAAKSVGLVKTSRRRKNSPVTDAE